MEKFNPTYSLTEFKNSNFRITLTAQHTAAELGFDDFGIREVVSTMELNHFYKSIRLRKNRSEGHGRDNYSP